MVSNMTPQQIKLGLPDEANKLTLSSVSAEYLQDADDSSSNADIQSLQINTEDAGAGVYFVIKTERWAFDSIQELIDVLQDFQKKLGNDTSTD